MLRAVQAVRPWGMLEVFMLGALVSIVKLGQLASVVVGPALYSIGALILDRWPPTNSAFSAARGLVAACRSTGDDDGGRLA